MCPSLGSFPLHDYEERIELHVRRMLRYMTPIVAFGFVIAVHLVDWAPVWRFAAPRRIQRLPRERAEQVLMAMSVSRWAPVRTMILGIRGITLSTFYDQDETHRAMGYDPLPFLSEKVELRRLLLSAPAPNEADRQRPQDGAR
jgi:hypothetical protein